jgi:hypothetical protein
MKTIIAIVTAAAALALGGASPGLAADDVAFEAELHHFTAPVPPCPAGAVCTSVSYGYAFSNLMAALVRVTAYFTWDRTTTPCSTMDPLVFILAGDTGSITISGSGTICPGVTPQVSPNFLTGIGEITDGTGEFSGSTGRVTSKGTLGPHGPVFHMTGTVSHS